MAGKKASGGTEGRPRKAGVTERITRLEQVRALSHPLRLRLLEMFAERPRTTMQAAEELGEAPTRLYHHVAALERAGLIRVRETRRKRGTTEKYFEAVAHRYLGGEQAAVDLGDKGTQRDLEALGLVVFDQARNELVQALASAKKEEPPALVAVRAVLRLSPRGAKRLKKELHELLERLHFSQQGAQEKAKGARSRGARRRYSLTLALVPTEQGGGESE